MTDTRATHLRLWRVFTFYESHLIVAPTARRAKAILYAEKPLARKVGKAIGWQIEELPVDKEGWIYAH